MNFAWRSHFVAACVAPLPTATREAAEAKGWTVFELPGTFTTSVPDAMISMLGG
jgi:hypothetical protein